MRLDECQTLLYCKFSAEMMYMADGSEYKITVYPLASLQLYGKAHYCTILTNFVNTTRWSARAKFWP